MGMNHRILIVDDDPGIVEVLQTAIENEGLHVETANDGLTALTLLELDIDLVMTDASMPYMDGYELSRAIRNRYNAQEMPIIMITGSGGRDNRIRAIEVGVNDFLEKPFDLLEVKVRCESLLKMKSAHDALKEHEQNLEKMVDLRTASLRKALEETAKTQRQLQQAYLETINRLISAAEFKDEGTGAHIARMSHFSAVIARKLSLPPREVELILQASPMHDIGKIGIPEKILLKPGPLDEIEWETMKKHTLFGHQILDDSTSELLQIGAQIAIAHHEKWDGSGYPGGLAGEEIPLPGRICAVADVFDALISNRPYKKAFTVDEAFEQLQRIKGSHLDAQCVEILTSSRDELFTIMEKFGCDTTC